MKKASLTVLFVLLSALFVGCSWLGNLETSTTTPAGSSTTGSTRFIEVADENLTFQIGSLVPDWTNYFSILDESLIESFEVNSDFDMMEVFEAAGTFTVQVKLTLKTGDSVYESFQVQVVIPENFLSVEELTNLLEFLMNGEYFSYDGQTEFSYYESGVLNHLSIGSEYRQYFSLLSGENAFYSGNSYSLTAEGQSQPLVWFEGTYFQIDGYNINVISWNPLHEKWESMLVSLEEILGLDLGFLAMSFANLPNGLDVLDGSWEGTSYWVDIPISEENFSLLTSSEIMNVFTIAGLAGFSNQESMVSAATEFYPLINCQIQIDGSGTKLESIRFDFSEFLNSVAERLGMQGGEASDRFASAIVTLSGFSGDPIEIDIPENEIEYSPAGYSRMDLNREINDIQVDEDSHSIYYTLEDDHLLYKFDYENYQIRKIYFDILPTRIDIGGGKLYVSLSDGHNYYSEEAEYGGVGIVNLSDFTLNKVFDLDFDPFDIEVDENGFIYLSFGSNQHGSLRSINPNNGSVIDTAGGYYQSEILYSDWTHHLYYVELMTTDNSLTVFGVQSGVFSQAVTGDQGFAERGLTLSPDGNTLYSRDGMIFYLSPSASSDGKISGNLGFSFSSLAFNPEDGLMFFAMEDGIFAIDESGRMTDAYSYSFVSQKLMYAEGKIFNVGSNYIEILDLSKPDEGTLDVVTLLNYGESFSPQPILSQYGFGDYDVVSVEGSVDEEALGTYAIHYELTDGTDSMTFTIQVIVVDLEGPSIHLPDDEVFEVMVGSDFVPSDCIPTDNYDDSPTWSVFQNNVDVSILGTYSVVYRAVDSSGNASFTTFYYQVILPVFPYDIETTIINGLIGETTFDVGENALFYIATNTKEVVRYDLDTKITQRLKFDYLPEQLLIREGKLYVTLIHQGHSDGWDESSQTGEIAVIDVATFNLDSLNWVTVDPYSIAVTGGYIYIASGSGQWVNMISYKLPGFTDRRVMQRIRQQMVLENAPGSSYIFAINTDLSPQSIFRYEVRDGAILSSGEDPGHGDYEYGTEIFASPNIDYVFSSYGQAFLQVSTFTDPLLGFVFDLNFDISAFYYDEVGRTCLFGRTDGHVILSSPDSYGAAKEVIIGKPVDQIFGTADDFIVISHSSTGLTLIHATAVGD